MLADTVEGTLPVTSQNSPIFCSNRMILRQPYAPQIILYEVPGREQEQDQSISMQQFSPSAPLFEGMFDIY